MKKILKSFIFVLAGVLTVVGLASCGHSHKYTYESDNTKHRQVCECGDKKEWEAHVWGDWTVTQAATEDAKGSRKHTCTVCSKEVAEDIKQLDPELAVNTEAMDVYAQVPADWEEVNIYYWNSLGEESTLDAGYAVGWPGLPMTLVDETSHLWGFEIPVGVEWVIFNNAGSVQTVDIKLAKAKNLYVLSAETNGDGKFESTYSSYTAKDTDPELNKPVFKEAGYVVSYVTVLEGWENANVYWTGSARECDEWPGVAMTAVEGATNVYTFDKVPDDAKKIIFNNGTNQTVDIPVVKGLNGYIIQEDVDADSKHLAKNGEYNSGTKAIDEVTMVDFYAQVPADWENVYIHFWEGAAGLKPAGFPGFEMTVVDETNHIYKYSIDSRVKTIIIDAGKDVENEAGEKTTDYPQTPNTSIDVEGVNAVIVTAAEDSNGAQATLAKYEDEAITEVEVEAKFPDVYVRGLEGWDVKDKYKLTVDGNKAVITLDILVGKSFKIADSGYVKQFGYVNTLGAEFAEGSGGNISCVTAGNYRITISGIDADEQTLTIERLGDATLVEDHTITELYVVGTINDWAKSNNHKMTIDNNTATFEITLAADAEFKVFDGNWDHNWATFGYVDTLGAEFANANGNIKVVTPGTYVITVSNLNTTPVLSIQAK